MRKQVLLLGLLCAWCWTATAQVPLTTLPVASGEKVAAFQQAHLNLQPFNGAALMQQQLAQQNPAFATAIQQYLQALPSLSQLQPTTEEGAESPPVLTIPVVVHVIHDPADPIGTGTNLSIQRIQSQIDALNDAFRQQNLNFSTTPLVFQGVAADPEIEFCLANIGPNGQATNGIHRQAVPTSSITSVNYIETNIKPTTQWNPAQYFNLWTVAIPNTSTIGGIQGYAYFPVSGFAGISPLDGAVVDYRFFGVGHGAVGSGVAAIREAAHYLGLPDIWGGLSANGMPIGCSSDDGINDTPPQAAPTGMTFPNCPSSIPQSCGTNDMYVNFMDYMKDQSCQTMFTTQQSNVMRAVLTGLAGALGYGDRSSLINSGASACSQSCAITLNATTTPESCGGPMGGLGDGTATVTATGGTQPYSFAWNTPTPQTLPTATGLAAGTYQVTVTDFTGCIQIQNITVSSASNVSATFQVNDQTCAGNDGFVVAQPTGGVAPYTIAWGTNPPQVNDTLLGVNEGIYPVSITDALGCTFSDVVFVYNDCNQVCDTLFNNDPTSGTPTIYINPYNGGFLSGTNGFGDLAKADYYDYQGTNTHVLGAFFLFGVADFGSAASTLEVVVWDGSTGTPGAELGSQAYPIAQIAANIAAFQPTFVPFSTPVDINGAFFLGFKIPNAANGDTIAVATNTIGDIPAGFGTAWEQWSDGSWHSYLSAWGEEFVHGMSPIVGTLPEALFTPGNITACDSTAITFTNLSTNATVNIWTLPGADTLSPISVSPTVTYNAPGTFDASLLVVNGCVTDTLIATGAITINACPTSCNLYAELSATPVNCHGGNTGTVTVTPSSGTGTYSFLWSNGATTATVTGLTAGNYSVTVSDAAGCSVVGNVTVSSPDPLVLTTSQVDESCLDNDGEATVMVSGGAGNYTYQWNTTPVATTDAIAGLSNGSYSVTVTDANGCTANTSIVIVDACTGCALDITATPSAPSCAGDADGSITVTPQFGNPPYQYDWSNGAPSTDSIASNLTAGVYTVLVTDGQGCIDSARVLVAQPDSIALTLASSPESCAGMDGAAVVVPQGGNGNFTFQWNTTPPTVTPQLIGQAAGLYTVLVTDANGCIAVDSVMIVDGCPCGDTVTVSTTAETCIGNNGTATATTDTSGTYSFLWSTGDTTATITGLDFGVYTVTVTNASGCVTVASAIVQDDCNCGMILNTTAMGETCTLGGDGSATVAVSGIAIPPFTYTWNTTPIQTTATAIGLAQGTYAVTVTDATGCVQTTTVNVPGTVSASINVVNASCNLNNGSLQVIAQGGRMPYQYLWDLNGSVSTNDSVSGLGAGTYNVTVTDASGCTASTTGIVVQNGTFNVNTVGIDNFCSTSGASASAIAVGGGTAPFSFAWGAPANAATANINNLSTGTYTVTVTDANGCLNTGSVNVTSLDASPDLSVSQTNVSCFGSSDGAIDLTINASTAYAVAWSNGVNAEDIANLAAGNYTVVVVDANGCVASTTVAISQPNPLIVSSTSTPTSDDDGTASAVPSGGTPPYNFLWNNGATAQTITGLTPGTYTVTVTDVNGCTANGAAIVDLFSSAGDLVSLTQFDLFPNPTPGQFTVQLGFQADTDAQVTIYNAVGQQVWTRTTSRSAETIDLDLSQWPAGVYSVAVTTDTGQAVKRVLIVR